MQYKWVKYTDSEFEKAAEIRRKVFCMEVGFTEECEFDGSDEKALHLIICDDNRPVAVARILPEGENTMHFGRLRRLKEERGKGWGKAALSLAMEKAKELGGKKMILGAKQDKIGFYEKFGFSQVGDIYYEEGIPHVNMEKPL